MNLSAGALFMGLITGLLGAWLFLWMSERQHTDYRVQESHVYCDKARFDTDFARGKDKAVMMEREKVACGELSTQIADRRKAEEKAKAEGEKLKKSIENALTSEEIKAQQAEVAARAAASAVIETAQQAIK